MPLGASEVQAEVARLVGWGYTDAQIAEILNVSVGTVKTHVRFLFVILKIDVRDRRVLGREARRIVEAQRQLRPQTGPENEARARDPEPAKKRRRPRRDDRPESGPPGS